MSYFKGDDGKEYKIFGESGVKKTAEEFNKEFLGHLPIHQDLSGIQLIKVNLNSFKS